MLVAVTVDFAYLSELFAVSHLVFERMGCLFFLCVCCMFYSTLMFGVVGKKIEESSEVRIPMALVENEIDTEV